MTSASKKKYESKPIRRPDGQDVATGDSPRQDRERRG